jgi:hypothetical protein
VAKDFKSSSIIAANTIQRGNPDKTIIVLQDIADETLG